MSALGGTAATGPREGPQAAPGGLYAVDGADAADDLAAALAAIQGRLDSIDGRLAVLGAVAGRLVDGLGVLGVARDAYRRGGVRALRRTLRGE